MTCPAALTQTMYVDGALSGDEAAAVASHAEGCAACRRRLELLRQERTALRQALRRAETAAPIPPFAPPPMISALLAWLGWSALAAWAVNLAWLTVGPLEPPLWLQWLAPDALGTGVSLLLGTLVRLAADGQQLWLRAVSAGGLASLVLLLAALAWLLPRRRNASQALLPALLSLPLLALAPTPGHAFELRRDESRVTVGADETVDDTLVAMAEIVLVEGTVTGDLVVLGERVTVRGRVDGNLLAFAEEVSVEGEVGGTVLGAGETVSLRGAVLSANAYTLGETVTIASDVRIAGNLAAAASGLEAHGSVGRDLLAAARSVTLRGSTERDLHAYAGTVSLEDGARVGGDLYARVRGDQDLQIADGATVAGETTREHWPERPNRFATADFYLGQLLSLAAAFVTGLVLFALFPGLRGLRLETGSQLLTAAAFGALALIVVPVAAVVITITLIGAPIGILTLALWLAALYLAGIIAADLLGRRLLDPARHRPALLLLLGLAVLQVIGIVPFLGGLVGFAALLLGLGVIALWLRGLWGSRAAA